MAIAIGLLLICLLSLFFVWKAMTLFTPKSKRFPKGEEAEVPKELNELEFSKKRGGFFRRGIDDKGITIDHAKVHEILKRASNGSGNNKPQKDKGN